MDRPARLGTQDPSVGWNWPLRIGFLQGSASRLLRQQLEHTFRTSSLNQLVDFVDLLNDLKQDVDPDAIDDDWRM